MSSNLTGLQKQLCNALQEGLAVCERPFSEMAKLLNSNEEKVLQEINELRTGGVIRRICAPVNYHALGRKSTLVAAHVPEPDLHRVVEAVNGIEDVSHNYLREHYYNLWFTLQGQTAGQIDAALSELCARCGVDFHSLPAERVFKLDVRFDAEDCARFSEDTKDVPKNAAVELNDNQRLVLSRLQNGIKPAERAFDFLCDEQFDMEDVLRIIAELIDLGVVRRIAAVVDHRKLGFVANVLFAAEAGRDRIESSGKILAGSAMVSHCYQRRTFEGWPYNLFAMMHGKSMSDVHREINKFVEAEKMSSFQLLPTVAELKKQPVKYRL